MSYRFISADNHLDLLWTPRNLWQEGLPAHLREAGPRVVETDRGSMWTFEGRERGAAADGSSNEQLLNIVRDRGFEAPSGSLPPSDPVLMLEYLDQTDTYAAVVFGGLAWKSVQDPELNKAVYAAYNEFALGVWSAAPDRLVVLPNLTARFPEDCPGQIRELARRGVKAVEFPSWDGGAPLWDEVWEPIWQAAAETGVRLCAHLGVHGGPNAIPPRKRGANVAWAAAQPLIAGLPLAQLIFSGVFERYPTLQYCYAETRIGWAPFFLDWMDRQVRIGRANDPRRAADTGPRDDVYLSMLPSEYFRRNIVLTFEDDTVGVEHLGLRSSVLADTALWGGDYPHPQGLWGKGVAQQLDDMFEGIDERVKRRVLLDHAAEFFDLTVPA